MSLAGGLQRCAQRIESLVRRLLVGFGLQGLSLGLSQDFGEGQLTPAP
jgi:hypothetical protein